MVEPKKKVWVGILLCLLFAMPSSAVWVEDLICQLNQPCAFALRTMNGSEPIGSQICNITIWNSTEDIFLSSTAMQNYSSGWQNFSYTFNVSGTYRFAEVCILAGVAESKSGLVVVKGMIESTLAFPIVTLLMSLLFGFFAVYLNNKAMQPIKIGFFMLCLLMLYFTTHLMGQQAEIEGVTQIAGIMYGLSSGLLYIIEFIFGYIIIMFIYVLHKDGEAKKAAKNKGGYTP